MFRCQIVYKSNHTNQINICYKYQVFKKKIAQENGHEVMKELWENIDYYTQNTSGLKSVWVVTGDTNL